jgi:hypothetical protein
MDEIVSSLIDTWSELKRTSGGGHRDEVDSL